ncbi:hypothetical protein [Streptomyces sp. CT34]|uniref:hypothetical protein n=1 Tax=Streptomyces sp. CT34 TaxID=1553907 RepID=UPI0005B919FC|nr:hypothetical protein [Streptomyces sp. CT34]
MAGSGVRAADEEADVMCGRLHEALRGAGFNVEPPLVATVSTTRGVMVDKIVPPLLLPHQAERLCKLLEAGRR